VDADERADHPLFGDLLRRHRLIAGLTQEELAERAGLSRRGISDLERTARSHPYRETVRVLADALNLAGGERTAFFLAAKRPVRRSQARRDRFTTLPVPLAPLIGRHKEQMAVRQLLQDDAVRLVTLIGPGGVGKTRLALGVAELVDDAFPDGQVFIELARLRDPSLMLSSVATALGIRESGARAFLDAVRDFLREREMLLILDNFEHLLPAAAQVADLLAAGPKVKVLTTSRAPLRVRGEREYPVPTLSLPTPEAARDLTALAATDAVTFFVDRVQAVRPDFALTLDNAAAVIAICHRLDGLPLALELAAARTKILPPATLLARLDARLPLLTGGTRDAPERQRTLRHAIAWSDDLLSPEARILFHRLGVFVGGWTLEAAEAVANLEGDLDVLEGLGSLADLSLIRLDERGPEPRYGMLETIREFAAERLASSGEEPALREAHAAYFLGLAEQGKPYLYGAGQRAWLRRLEAEHPNFHVALTTLAANDDDRCLRLTADLGLFWFLHAHFAEGRAYLERALSRTTSPTPHRAEALLGVGRLAELQGEFGAAKTWFVQSEQLARSLDLPAVLWQALFERGIVAEWQADTQQAVSLYESAVAVARELKDAQAIGVPLYALSEVAYGRGDLETAERLSKEAVGLVRSAGDDFVLSMCLATIGAVALARGDLPCAIGAYHEALELALGIDADFAIASALVGFAAVAAARGDYVTAAKLLGAIETIREASRQDRTPNYYLHAQTTQAVRTALSESAFTTVLEAGRALATEDVIAEVLELAAELADAQL
jgi:predicted ATPase/DNA-binding XRE family transcriptional regulator